MFTKKGDNEGRAVMVLILVIAVLMTLYIIFIPPEERETLLYPNGSSSLFVSSAADKLELLSEIPGSVSPVKQQSTVHNLVPVNLYIKTEPKSITISPSLTVSKGLFSSSSPTLFFNLDKKDLSKLSLFFSTNEASGILKISINGNQFYSQALETGVSIIEIPLSFVTEKNNKIEFSVSGPGLAFWSSNKYSLENIGIKEEFERINSKEERTFIMPRLEKDSLESAKLSFFQVCNLKFNQNSVPLKVYMNNNPTPALSTRIKCLSTQQSVEIDPSLFIAGQNSILFVLEEAGDFTFNEVKLSAIAKQTDYPQYSFSISTDQFDDIKSGNKNIELELFLDNNEASKSARISVNAGDIFLQTKSGSFTYDLKDYIEQGSNFIRIVPSNDFAINGLKVSLY